MLRDISNGGKKNLLTTKSDEILFLLNIFS